MTGRRWLITGTSSGLGAALAKAALAIGDQVAGTTRSPDAARAFSAIAPGRSFGIHAACQDVGQAAAIVAEGIAAMGGLDRLVNNAGYALSCAVEVASESETRAQFDANLFGPLALARAALPHLLETGGRILNISSLAALESYPGLGLYCASKAALSAASEALDREVAPLGVRVIAIEPGGMRTAFAGGSLRTGEGQLDRYVSFDADRRAAFARSDGNQTGDPARISQFVIALADHACPPARVLVGDDVLTRAEDAFAARLEGYRRMIALSSDIAFP
ncbi:SDR family NAD(P)-dependent oxidoreductase [Novosphingobium lindaniclasticum]|uniref:SDR family NAD(P)-dependent oxidoreductase n=1 Tax=Novosphingobium lindaniclasticum TaxID=1329895 RepID=UPI00040FFED4|nr:SDR family NAD(P)-dependent oxidoreductase [Novosphingobium lindaniclasticum]